MTRNPDLTLCTGGPHSHIDRVHSIAEERCHVISLTFVYFEQPNATKSLKYPPFKTCHPLQKCMQIFGRTYNPSRLVTLLAKHFLHQSTINLNLITRPLSPSSHLL